MEEDHIAREFEYPEIADLINLRLMLQQIHNPTEEITKAKTHLDKTIAELITSIEVEPT
jgi:hypothetical protein